MKAQQLKNAILQLAIQGKLVPQDPNDEPASELLCKIQAEKDRLIEEGKIKKSKKSADKAPYTIKPPFEIPESWVWATLDDIFYLQAGKFISASKIYGENNESLYPCYGGNGLRGFVENYNRDGYFPLIGRQGALCGNINLAKGKFYATEHAVVVETFAETNVKWAFYFLKQLNLNQYSTATAQPGLSVNKINNVLIPLPPLNEQHLIVKKIEELLPLVERYDQTEQKLTKLNDTFPEQLKKSVLQVAIQGKLTEQLPTDEPASELLKRIETEKMRLISEGKLKKPRLRDNSQNAKFEPPFEIPQGWEWVKLEQLGILTSGKTPKTEQLSKNGKIPYFKVSDMNSDGNELYLKNSLLFLDNFNGITYPKNSIVFPKNGGAVFTNKKRILVTNSVVDLNTGVFIPFESNFFKYIFTIFSTIDFRQHYKGTALPTVDLSMIGKLSFPLPPLQEQKRIVEKVELLLSQIEKLS